METGWTGEDVVDYRKDSVEAGLDVERMRSGDGAAALAVKEGDRIPLAAAELDSLVRFVAGRMAADATVVGEDHLRIQLRHWFEWGPSPPPG